MNRLTIMLLGTPQVFISGKPIKLGRQKALALLAYLAATNQSHRRDRLATLLWPESDQQRAKASLRMALTDLKKSLGTEWLDANRQAIALNQELDIWVDVLQFQHMIKQDQLAQAQSSRLTLSQLSQTAAAVSFYKGAFLQGFSLPDTSEFENWLRHMEQNLQQLFSESITHLIEACLAESKTAEGRSEERR